MATQFKIRGDRLLLFLDVVRALRSYSFGWKRWSKPELQNPRGLSFERMQSVLQERCGFSEYGEWGYRHCPIILMKAQGIYRFLFFNMDQLGTLELVSPINLVSDEQMEGARRAFAEYERLLNEEANLTAKKRWEEQIREQKSFLEQALGHNRLLSLIAAGELTEADFKEVE